jgi:class 3 adenylate cyclase
VYRAARVGLSQVSLRESAWLQILRTIHTPLSASEIKAATSIRMGETAAGAETLEGERKTVTALFADIKGSMELMRDL